MCPEPPGVHLTDIQVSSFEALRPANFHWSHLPYEIDQAIVQCNSRKAITCKVKLHSAIKPTQQNQSCSSRSYKSFLLFCDHKSKNVRFFSETPCLFSQPIAGIDRTVDLNTWQLYFSSENCLNGWWTRKPQTLIDEAWHMTNENTVTKLLI